MKREVEKCTKTSHRDTGKMHEALILHGGGREGGDQFNKLFHILTILLNRRYNRVH